MEPYDERWPAAQRLRVIAAMVSEIQLDIPAGRYGVPGRVNCQSVLHVALEDAPVLHEAIADAPAFMRKAAGLL